MKKGNDMSKREIGWLIGGVVAGIVFAGQIKRLPLVSKIPQV
jgi:hypothetical protein